MKSCYRCIVVVAILLCSHALQAQTAASYFLGLRAGNALVLHTTEFSTEPHWSSRTTRKSFEGTDLINGITYYRYVGREIPDDAPLDTSIFHMFWLRSDDAGNILLGAVATGYPSIDSAFILPVPQPWFPNSFLTVGYTLTFPQGSSSLVDSIMSITESVTVPAGTFTNCMKMSERRITSQGIVELEEFAWFAPGVGEVKRMRTIPVEDAHTDVLMSYQIATGVEEEGPDLQPAVFSLSQNYPNPFNPATAIRYYLPGESHVRLTISNVLGQEVQALVDATEQAGEKTVRVDAGALPSGLYFYRLEAAPVSDPTKHFSRTRTMMLVK